MTKQNIIIGIDIGGTNVRIGAVSQEMVLVDAVKQKSASVFTGGDAGAELSDFIADYIAGLDGTASAIAIGFPSTLDRARRAVISTPNVKGLDNIPVVALLEQRFGIPVVIEKDACMLLYNDIHQHRLPTSGVVIGCYFGTGIGNIILVDGQPIVGKDGVAGELSHIPAIGKHEKCSCGNEGCMEMYAAGRALVTLMETTYPETPIGDVFKVHGDEAPVHRLIDNMAIVVAIEVNILNPDIVVLGGGLLGMDGFPLPLFERYIRKHARKPLPEETLKLVYSDQSAPFCGVVGAAVYAKHILKN